MSASIRRSTWIISLLVVTYALTAPAATELCGVDPGNMPAPADCLIAESTRTAADGTTTERAPSPNTSAVAWVWLAFSALGLGVVAAAVAANRPRRSALARSVGVRPLQESLAQLDHAS